MWIILLLAYLLYYSLLYNKCLFQTESYMTFTVRANFYVSDMNYLVSEI